MDGYALRCADVPAAGTVLPVSQRIPAGQVGQPLLPGTAARIFTGAQIPPGADAVVMQELTTALTREDGSAAVRFDTVPTPGSAIRRRGEDVARGSLLLSRGQALTPAALGLAASVGQDRLAVAGRVRVALLSTGDELVTPGSIEPEKLPPGRIFNSNRSTLHALLVQQGCVVTDLGPVPDQLEATREALQRAALDHDLILSSGGVSVGEEDHVRAAVMAEGRLDLWQIAMKPGKPFAFGALRRPQGGEAVFVGLPGNPVSSWATFLLMVRPLLQRLQGVTAPRMPAIPMRADFHWPRPDKRREFLRVRINATGGLELFPQQGSGVLTSAAWADGLADIAAGQVIEPGAIVPFVPVDLGLRGMSAA
jgi:molybdopterin molybdotransferase